MGIEDGKEFEAVMLDSEKGSTDYNDCLYIIKGGDNKDESQCDSKRENEYLGLKDEFVSILSDLDIKSDDLKDYLIWFSENKVEAYKKDVEDYKKNQESLTPDEVYEKFADNYFKLTKTADGFLLSGMNEKLYISQKEENAGFMYDDNAADKSEDHMSYYFTLKGKLENGVDKNGSCVYDLKRAKTTKGNCSSSQIKEIDRIKSYFDFFLDQNHISFDEFITFSTDYTAK